MTSLPVRAYSGECTDSILGASNFKRLSCRSFHLIRILLLFLLFLVSSRMVIFKNFSSHSRRRTLQAADFFLYLPQIARSLLKNNVLFSNFHCFLQGDGSAQTHRHGVHFLQHHMIYALNFISRRYTNIYGR